MSVLIYSYVCHSILNNKQGAYDFDYEAVEPDPYIADLNAELVQCNEILSAHLPETGRR